MFFRKDLVIVCLIMTTCYYMPLTAIVSSRYLTIACPVEDTEKLVVANGFYYPKNKSLCIEKASLPFNKHEESACFVGITTCASDGTFTYNVDRADDFFARQTHNNNFDTWTRNTYFQNEAPLVSIKAFIATQDTVINEGPEINAFETDKTVSNEMLTFLARSCHNTIAACTLLTRVQNENELIQQLKECDALLEQEQNLTRKQQLLFQVTQQIKESNNEYATTIRRNYYEQLYAMKNVSASIKRDVQYFLSLENNIEPRHAVELLKQANSSWPPATQPHAPTISTQDAQLADNIRLAYIEKLLEIGQDDEAQKILADLIDFPLSPDVHSRGASTNEIIKLVGALKLANLIENNQSLLSHKRALLERIIESSYEDAYKPLVDEARVNLAHMAFHGIGGKEKHTLTIKLLDGVTHNDPETMSIYKKALVEYNKGRVHPLEKFIVGTLSAGIGGCLGATAGTAVAVGVGNAFEILDMLPPITPEIEEIITIAIEKTITVTNQPIHTQNIFKDLNKQLEKIKKDIDPLRYFKIRVILSKMQEKLQPLTQQTKSETINTTTSKIVIDPNTLHLINQQARKVISISCMAVGGTYGAYKGLNYGLEKLNKAGGIIEMIRPSSHSL